MAYDKQIPFCVTFLASSAVVCHLLVLVGNLHTAHMFSELGRSSTGWGNVGVSLATALKTELQRDLGLVSYFLDDSIRAVEEIETGIDDAFTTSGTAVDGLLDTLGLNVSVSNITEVRDGIMSVVDRVVAGLLVGIDYLMEKFLKAITPALEKIQGWLLSFGEKIQDLLEEFGTTLDRAEKVFDNVLGKLSPATGYDGRLVLNTYSLVDTNNDGRIRTDDLKSIGELFGIQAFAGEKAEELFTKYDADSSGSLSRDQFELLIHDPSIPGVVTEVLRTYARRLSSIAGRVKAAYVRDDVGQAVVDYLALVCAKNMTKVRWIAQALTNQSMPLDFTADVLKNLAVDVDNPNKLTIVDTGETVITAMMEMDAAYVVDAMTLMSRPEYWDSEGFDLEGQPQAVKQVVTWIIQAGGLQYVRNMPGIPIYSEAEAKENLPDAAFQVSQQRIDRYLAQHRTAKAALTTQQYNSTGSKKLREGLLGGASAQAIGDNPDAVAALKKGVPAVPQTLQFAEWLANNATRVANGFMQDCFDHSGESSSPTESVANPLSGIIKKVQGLLGLMSSYSTKKGLEQFRMQARNFTHAAMDDIMLLIEHYLDDRLSLLACKAQGGSTCTARQNATELPLMLTGGFTFLTRMVQDLKGVLPVVISDLRLIQREVGAVETTLVSAMDIMRGQTPAVFYQISSIYKTLWISYFIIFSFIAIGMICYGFWSRGWFGGPDVPAEVEGYVPPQGFRERMQTCWHGCNDILWKVHDNPIGFWSMLMFMEVVLLALFLTAVTVVVLAAVQTFMINGCSQLYILEDQVVCTVSLQTAQVFLRTFWSKKTAPDIMNIDILQTCVDHSLLTCKIIAENLADSLKITTFGSIVAAIISLQLLIESAVRREQLLFRRMLDAEAKEAKEA